MGNVGIPEIMEDIMGELFLETGAFKICLEESNQSCRLALQAMLATPSDQILWQTNGHCVPTDVMEHECHSFTREYS